MSPSRGVDRVVAGRGREVHRLMPRWPGSIVPLGCLAALTVCSFGAVLFRGEQFGFRDAAHYYYPLHLRIQQEWASGRIPLWEPEQNGGMPLLGNPTAAVLYPGKIVFALLPYPWAARLYVVGHTLLAFAAMGALSRSLGIGTTGAGVASLAYAFGAPVLFLGSNVIFLVGASWMPLGLRAADRALRRGRRWGWVELAGVLAMQVLGGDPEAACLTGLAAGLYAVVLVVPSGLSDRWRPVAAALAATTAGWGAFVLMAAWRTEGGADQSEGPGWMPTTGVIVPLAWVVLGVIGVRLARSRPALARPVRMGGGLAASGLVALLICGAQVVPTAGLVAESNRAGPVDWWAFSLEPWRAIELVWPNVFGRTFPENRSWLLTLQPERGQEFWTPSLYLGGPTLVLALAAAGCRSGPAGRSWLTLLAAISLTASLGRYAGPPWAARNLPALAEALGPHDATAGGLPRPDGRLPDGFGGPYWLLATTVPGFGAFRYPSKLLVPMSLALAGLAGMGWDRLVGGRTRRALIVASCWLASSLILLAVTATLGPAIVSAWGRMPAGASLAGPLDSRGALADLRGGLIHGAIVFALLLALIRVAPRRPHGAGAMLLVVLTADLALANAGLVWTVPQTEFDRRPEALARIEAAERSDPSEGPFRVHRMPPWYPLDFVKKRSPDRLRELVAWERDTLQPEVGITDGVSYTLTPGVLERDAYLRSFQPELRPATAAEADRLGLPPGGPILVYPRSAFDRWTTRYFLLPADPHGWSGESRGIASFLGGVTPIHPDLADFDGPEGPARMASWRTSSDWQLLRNESALPRAWVVHEVRTLRDSLPELGDPRTTAWVEAEERRRLASFLPRTPPTGSERVTIDDDSPQRVALTALLERPGLVILADAYDPGWRLMIDGAPAPLLRANLGMRAAAVPQGSHRLVFTYRPASFRVGVALSAVGLVALGLLATRANRQPPGAGLAA